MRDLRGTGGRMPLPLGRGGRLGGGVGVLVILVLVFVVGGPDAVMQLLSGATGTVAPTGQQGRPLAAGDEAGEFVARVLGSTEDVWGSLFAQSGQRYEPPALAVFAGSVRSACGFASSASGPFYCPADRQVYLDTAFFDELARMGGASGWSTRDGAHRLVAQATIAAVQEFLDGEVAFGLPDVEFVRMGRRRMAVVSLSLLAHRQEKVLVGSCAVEQDVQQAVVLATLAALNRIVGGLPTRVPTEYVLRPTST